MEILGTRFQNEEAGIIEENVNVSVDFGRVLLRSTIHVQNFEKRGASIYLDAEGANELRRWLDDHIQERVKTRQIITHVEDITYEIK